MAWKKLIYSGSDAALSRLTVDTYITASAVSASYFDLDNIVSSSAPVYKEGRIFYDAELGALTVYNDESEISLQVGQETYIRVFNNGIFSIVNGTPVYISGSQGDYPYCWPAVSQDHTVHGINENHIIGVATHTIEAASTGYVTTQGTVRGIDTSNFAAGDILFVSSSVGQITNIQPPNPFDVITVGYVVRSHPSAGIIYVYPKEPTHITRVSEFTQSANYSDGDLWVYNSTKTVWENRKTNVNISGSFSGSFSGNGTQITGVISASYALSASWSPYSGGGVTDHGALTGLLDDDHPQYLKNSLTSSMSVLSSSFAVSASWAPGSSQSVTASYALTASYLDSRLNYVHTQSSAATTWTVFHNLNSNYLNVTVWSASKVVIPEDIISIGENALQVVFPSAQSGYVTTTVGSFTQTQINATSATSASYAITAVSSSYAISSSYSDTSAASSYAISASYSDISISSSYAVSSVSSSYTPQTKTFGLTIDGGGSAITTGIKGDITIPFDCTINSWYLVADAAGSIVIDVWKDTFANYPPTVLDSIAGTEKPTLSSVISASDTNLTTWSKTVTAGDVIRFNVDSASTITRVTLTIKAMI